MCHERLLSCYWCVRYTHSSRRSPHLQQPTWELQLGAAPLDRQYVREHRQRLGYALQAYLFSEFTGAAGQLGRAALRPPASAVLLLIGSSVAVGSWLLAARGGGAGEGAGAALLLTGTSALYTLLATAFLVWFCLTYFGPLIRESFAERVRMHVVAMLDGEGASGPADDPEALAAWRDDLALLSERLASVGTFDKLGPLPATALLVACVAPFIFGGVIAQPLLDRVPAVSIHSLTLIALTTGVAIVLASRLLPRFNAELYEGTLEGEIRALAQRLDGAVDIAGHARLSVVAAIGRVRLGWLLRVSWRSYWGSCSRSRQHP